MGWIPDIRKFPGFRRIKTERDRQIIKDDIFFGQGEVMHHRFVVDGDLGYAAHSAGIVDDEVLDIIPTIRIRDGVKLASPRVELSVRGKTAGQGAGEIVRPNRIQFIGDFVWQRTPSTVARIRPA